MARSKASKTKTALYEVMVKASAANSSSRSVVDAVKADPSGREAIAAERDDIIDLGLMIMAGRIAARPAATEGQGELFPLGRPKEFTVLRSAQRGSNASGRVPTASIQMQQWFDQPKRPLRLVENHHTNEDILDAYFNKMKKEGMPPDMTLGQYLDKK